MKKIIFSLCIAIIACLSATYVNAKKTPINYYEYGRSFDQTYKRLYTIYNYSNCVAFTPWDRLMKCGYILKYDGMGAPPEYLGLDQIQDLLISGDILPISNTMGIYLDD